MQIKFKNTVVKGINKFLKNFLYLKLKNRCILYLGYSIKNT